MSHGLIVVGVAFTALFIARIFVLVHKGVIHWPAGQIPHWAEADGLREGTRALPDGSSIRYTCCLHCGREIVRGVNRKGSRWLARRRAKYPRVTPMETTTVDMEK